MDKKLQADFRKDFIKDTLKMGWAQFCQLGLIEREYAGFMQQLRGLQGQVSQLDIAIKKINDLPDNHTRENRGKVTDLVRQKNEIQPRIQHFIGQLEPLSKLMQDKHNEATRYMQLAKFAETFEYEVPKPAEKPKEEKPKDKKDHGTAAL